MKFFRKLSIICLSLLACCSLGLAISCGGNSFSNNSVENSSSEEQEPTSYVYRIAVQNSTGFGLKKVPVSLYDGDTLVAKSTTNTNGYAYFRNEDHLELGKYKVVLDELPAGYKFLDETATYATAEVAGSQVTIPLTPTGVLLEGELPAGQMYSLGDIMYDFTATTAKGEEFKLSDTVAEKKLTVINFWATWCGPCMSEFPVMHNVLTQYQENVGCLAISTTDGMPEVRNTQEQGGYIFNMTSAGAGDNLASKFPTASIPFTLMVDRYGVIVFTHGGSMTDIRDWQMIFDTFIGDDYVPTVWNNSDDGGNDPDEGGNGNNRIEPTATAPTMDEVHKALNTNADEIKYHWQADGVVTEQDEGYDKYTWPWVSVQETDETGKEVTALAASNAESKINNSYATLYADITVEGGDVLTFDYKVGSELNYDILYVLVDGDIVNQISGAHHEQWNTCYSYVFSAEEAGEHEIIFLYSKDVDNFETTNGDIVRLRNLRLEKAEDGLNDSNNTLMLTQAATILNTEEGAKTQFKNYVDIVLNEKDNYYHVGTVDGPILFADLWYATKWSNMSVWQLALNGYCVVDGFNYADVFEEYAWEANNNINGAFNMHGLTPVTAELKELLQIVTEYVSYNPEWDNFKGEYHENEWLEICRYYQPYGNTPQLEDPMKTITFNAAVEIFEEQDNVVKVPFTINPRGFKYKFIPQKEGVYKVSSATETGSTIDPVTFLVDEDRKTFYGEWDNKITASVVKDENDMEISDGNFEYYWYFEAGKTYYMLFTTFLDQPGEYIVNIDYIGETYTYKAMAASAIYSANLVTGALFIPDAINYKYDATYEYTNEDGTTGVGCYRYVDRNGEMGGPIYLDAFNPTAFSPNLSLYKTAAEERKKENVEERQFYLNGKDYTEEIYDICHDAYKNDIKYIVVTEEIHEFLYALTVYSAHQGIDNSWLMLCYYDKILGKNN